MYKNTVTGIYELPWVRLHACKDYYDTVAILDSFPKIRSNFNLVPSLMLQLDEYAKGIAKDKSLEITLKQAETLNEDDKIYILQNFFMANWDTMILPYPRYAQLLEKRGKNTSKDSLKRTITYFKPQDFRDLQVWFNLSWMDPYWKEKDPLVNSLYAKGSKFSEEEKQLLIKKQLDICGMIVSKYKEMQEKGQIEVSVTPFYHPILPLLCDTNNARIATPHIALPKKRFQHRKDAQIQIQKAVAYYKEHFGMSPNGMWPSEGSVSEDIIPLLVEEGIKWIATDEEILFRTRPDLAGHHSNLYSPYKINLFDQQINIVFRDHSLSDAIGFVYAKWKPEHAVNDFIKRVHAIRESLSESNQNHLISVILDGENCWEYYQNDGWDFLKLLYKTLSEDPLIETTTINDFIKNNPPKETLSRLWAGSWINGNFGIWIGHAEDNLAWDYLSEARTFLTDYIEKHPEKADSEDVKSAWERIYIAEGSDWNWWYGDDHSSDNNETFDYLFRQHLIGVYESLGEKAPEYFHRVIKGIVKKAPTLEPIDFISPVIDGKVTNYFEWHAAGFYQVGFSGGSMHQVDTVTRAFYYGFNLENFYLRLDLSVPLNETTLSELAFKVIFITPAEREVFLSFKADGSINQFLIKTPQGIDNLNKAAAKKIVELCIPFEKLWLAPEDNTIEFIVSVLKNGTEIERWPYQSSTSFPRPSNEFLLRSWIV
jgi:alpha-amylase/alpha-mannosidase (GH57 family)